LSNLSLRRRGAAGGEVSHMPKLHF